MCNLPRRCWQRRFYVIVNGSKLFSINQHRYGTSFQTRIHLDLGKFAVLPPETSKENFFDLVGALLNSKVHPGLFGSFQAHSYYLSEYLATMNALAVIFAIFYCYNVIRDEFYYHVIRHCIIRRMFHAFEGDYKNFYSVTVIYGSW